MKNKILPAILVCGLVAFFWTAGKAPFPENPGSLREKPGVKIISDCVQKGETLFKIFSKHDLQTEEVLPIRNASLNVHPVRTLHPGRPYQFEIEEDGSVSSFRYWIDDDSLLDIRRDDNGFLARKEAIRYEKRTLVLEGVIEDNLVGSMGESRNNLPLALGLSDIYAWDIDFTSDLQKGDSYRIVVEGLYLDGQFRKFGKIQAAEFRNRGSVYRAYRYEHEGRAGYFDEKGKPLKKMFLRAPLSFRRISSFYSSGRFHPVLKIRRPHRGLDYAAPSGTPVSSVGDGVVLFAGRKGQYGRLVVIRHPNGWETCYGHLSRIASIGRGGRVEQGQVIGYVGSTGLATGPHLHYEVKHRGEKLDPLSVTASSNDAIPRMNIFAFDQFKRAMNVKLAGKAFSVASALPAEENARL